MRRAQVKCSAVKDILHQDSAVKDILHQDSAVHIQSQKRLAPGSYYKERIFFLPLSFSAQLEHYEDSDTFTACWVSCCLHNPSNSDMGYRIFNVRM